MAFSIPAPHIGLIKSIICRDINLLGAYYDSLKNLDNRVKLIREDRFFVVVLKLLPIEPEGDNLLPHEKELLQLLSSILQSCKRINLTHVKLNDAQQRWIFSKLTECEDLSFELQPELSSLELKEKSQQRPLKRSKGKKGKSIARPPTRLDRLSILTKLKRLTLRCPHDMKDAEIEQICCFLDLEFLSLRSVKLSPNTKAWDDIAKLKKLQAFHLSNCESLSESALDKIADSCEDLMVVSFLQKQQKMPLCQSIGARCFFNRFRLALSENDVQAICLLLSFNNVVPFLRLKRNGSNLVDILQEHTKLAENLKKEIECAYSKTGASG